MARDIQEIVQGAKAANAPNSMTTKIVAIDGPGGAGKSVLAREVAQALDAPIIQTDDFASWGNPLNWWPRLLEQVLEPLSQNKTAHYQKYDWEQKALTDWRTVKPSKYLILEGVSSSRKAFRPYLSYSVWVETPREERLRRGLERDGEEARKQWEQWMEEEAKYIAEEHPEQHVDVVVSGTNKRRKEL